jgi:hypothetical protein
MKALVFTMAWMVLGVAVFAQTSEAKPPVHDMKHPGLTEDGWLPWPRPDHLMKNGKLVNPPAKPMTEEQREIKAEKREKAEANRQSQLPSFLSLDGENALDHAHYSCINPFRGHYYQAFKADGITWHEAKKRCEAMGGHLVTVEDERENQGITWAFKGTWVAAGVFQGVFARWWMGASAEDGKWSWVNGEMWGYRHWTEGEKVGKNDAKGVAKILAERKRLIAEAEKVKKEMVAEAALKGAETVRKASDKKDTYAERAEKKSQDMLSDAEKAGDDIVLTARQKAGLMVLQATGKKVPAACEKLEDSVKLIEAQIGFSDYKSLNNVIGNYLYNLDGMWNARFADGGWLAEGDIPEGAEINGFMCEWDSKADIKFEEGCGFPPKGAEVNAMAMKGFEKMKNDPEFKKHLDEYNWQVAAEKARVSPTGKYKVTVVHPKTKEPKTFECEAENSWDAKNKVLKGLVDKFDKAGKKGELMGCTCTVEFAK